MIDDVMELIRNEVNQYVTSKNGSNGTEKVLLTAFVDDSGKTVIPKDTLGLSLLNIEEDRTLKQAVRPQLNPVGTLTQFANPPVALNLQIMFTANFTEYKESLKHISYILSCFQVKPSYNIKNTPALEGMPVYKLVFDLNTLGLEQQHYIWSMIGLRYLPSIIYKVRMLVVFEEEVAEEVPNIQHITTISGLKEVDD